MEEETPDQQEDIPSADDLVSKANEAAERLEKANEEHARLIAKQERLNVERTLGGHAAAGQPQEMTVEEKAIASAKAMLAGTGLEEHAFPGEPAKP